MKKKIVLIGGGGHVKSVIDVIESGNQFDILGIIDPAYKVGSLILNKPILGSDEIIQSLINSEKCLDFHISLGQIKTSQTRRKIYENVKKLGGNFPVIIAGNARVSKYCAIQEGSIIMQGASVIAGAQIGRCCIINNNALVEHDSSVGDFCHISTGAIVNGTCTIGDNTFIGSNTTVFNNLTITSNAIVSAHSKVYTNLLNSGVYKA
jgi:sugar O-acyltransferase (sialic acid O-acetyltransferase NeuD family)